MTVTEFPSPPEEEEDGVDEEGAEEGGTVDPAAGADEPGGLPPPELDAASSGGLGGAVPPWSWLGEGPPYDPGAAHPPSFWAGGRGCDPYPDAPQSQEDPVPRSPAGGLPNRSGP